MKVSEQIKAARISEKLTPKAAAELSGVSVRVWQYYEKGERFPSEEAFYKICKALKTDIIISAEIF